MRFWLAVLIVVFSSSSFAYADFAKNSLVAGAGTRSCEKLSSSSEIEGFIFESWILGYWSGVNAMNPLDNYRGRDTDTAGIIGEVKLFCSSHPSWNLSSATSYVYSHMAPALGR